MDDVLSFSLYILVQQSDVYTAAMNKYHAASGVMANDKLGVTFQEYIPDGQDPFTVLFFSELEET